jgi:hypothetical protein
MKQNFPDCTQTKGLCTYLHQGMVIAHQRIGFLEKAVTRREYLVLFHRPALRGKSSQLYLQGT